MRASTTVSLIAVVMALCMGFATGWWYRDLTSPGTEPTDIHTDKQPAQRMRASSSPPSPTGVTAPSDQAKDEEQKFGQMLATRRFGEATAFYYESVRADPINASGLRPTFDTFLQDCLRHCDAGTFIDLVDAWLATFYDDIPVLLTLARFQERQGDPEASGNTLLLAQTYALQAGDQRAISQALDQLSENTDERLSADKRWIELLGFYEYLAAIDLTKSKFELRRAQLYRAMGEQERASELVATLLATDDGSDSQWTDALEQFLRQTTPESTPHVTLSNAVPLERRGDGYVVEVTLNDQTTMKMLVDTGASMTVLTRDSFRQLNRPDFRLLGTRLFKTANGYTRGDVYRAVSLTLGHERVEGINIAVLDFQNIDEVDGLLGMNVLRQFSFKIDQVAAVLHLDRR